MCEDMQETLAEFSEEMGFSVREIDIDQDPVLRDRYNTLVPVLAVGETEICHYYLDKVALEQALQTNAT